MLALVVGACGSTGGTDGPDGTGAADVTDGIEAVDGPVEVAGDALRDALAGNTIVGTWDGEDYRQYFDPGGTTDYLPAGGEVSVGEWRVEVVTGRYESRWPPGRTWDPYVVQRDGDRWFWTGGGVDRSPFTILPGDQLSG